jgi:hypothetical protein
MSDSKKSKNNTEISDRLQSSDISSSDTSKSLQETQKQTTSSKKPENTVSIPAL